MSASPLQDVWNAAAASPYEPTIGKNSQFALGFSLLSFGSFSPYELDVVANLDAALIMSGYFSLSGFLTVYAALDNSSNDHKDPSLTNVPAIGIPASLACA